MPDADMEQVADALIGSEHMVQQEKDVWRCQSPFQSPDGEKTADQLIETLTPRVSSLLKLLPYTDTNADFGPVITKQSLDKINGYLEEGMADGAELVVDGRGVSLQGYENGYFIGGCLFDDKLNRRCQFTKMKFLDRYYQSYVRKDMKRL